MRKVRNPFVGAWRITEMSEWDRDVIDEGGPATIRFDANGGGEIRFIYVQGDLDCRYDDYDDYDDDLEDDDLDKPGVTFTWQGFDELDEASGSGWAILKTKNKLFGRIRFHGGDESTFTAKRKKSGSKHKRR
jgi:hypothetical protein